MAIQTIVIIQRHGNALPGEPDVERRLSEKGREQAAAVQVKLVERGYGGASVILSSRARRAMETVALDGNVTTLPELSLPTEGKDAAECARLFMKLGYAPLPAYLKEDATDSLLRWGENAIRAVDERALPRVIMREPGIVRIGGHAMLSNVLALEFIRRERREFREKIANLILGEACAIVLLSDEKGEPKAFELVEP